MNNRVVSVSDDALGALFNGIFALRDKAIVLLLAESGLRMSEVVALNRSSIRVEIHQMPDGTAKPIGYGQVIQAKTTGLEREFFVGPATIAALGAYLEAERNGDTQAALFLSTNGKRLDSQTVRRIVQKWTMQLGLAPFATHALRVGLVERFCNAGMHYQIVKKLLGYSGRDYFKVLSHPTRDMLIREYLGAITSFPWY